MMKKILMLAALAITPLLLSESASAQCYSGYGGYGYGGYGGHYRAPAVVYRAPHHHHHRASVYRAPISHYGSPYGYRSRYGYGGYGYGSGFYGRGNSIGVGRGGVSFRIAF